MVLIVFALAFVALLIGIKGFTSTGLPLTKNQNLTGRPAKIVGSLCLALGIALAAVGVWLVLIIAQRANT